VWAYLLCDAQRATIVHLIRDGDQSLTSSLTLVSASFGALGSACAYQGRRLRPGEARFYTGVLAGRLRPFNPKGPTESYERPTGPTNDTRRGDRKRKTKEESGGAGHAKAHRQNRHLTDPPAGSSWNPPRSSQQSCKVLGGNRKDERTHPAQSGKSVNFLLIFRSFLLCELSVSE
jgi:hypothetical protein